MNTNQRKLVQQFFELINIQKFSNKYYKHGSYKYLVAYIAGKFPRNKLMDRKIQSMILEYHDDCFETIEKITHKIQDMSI